MGDKIQSLSAPGLQLGMSLNLSLLEGWFILRPPYCVYFRVTCRLTPNGVTLQHRCFCQDFAAASVSLKYESK